MLWWQQTSMIFTDFHWISTLNSRSSIVIPQCYSLETWVSQQSKELNPLRPFDWKKHVTNSKYIKKIQETYAKKRCSSARNINKLRNIQGRYCASAVTRFSHCSDRMTGASSAPIRLQVLQRFQKISWISILLNKSLHRFSFCPARFKNILQSQWVIHFSWTLRIISVLSCSQRWP